MLLAMTLATQTQTVRFYAKDGRSLGTATTSTEGTTRYYGADGRSLGTATKEKKK
jgi:hypothetical protein